MANAASGKTARACDSCMRRRARWYCAADDAFLCQACDSVVHSANPLARRHDRVRLKTSSSSSSSSLPLWPPLPAWHHGLRRKARTPRHAKGSTAAPRQALLVPDLDINADNNIVSEEEEEVQLLYRVPIFDPALDETNPTSTEEAKPAPAENQRDVGLPGFNPSDAELAEFAADVESMLGHGLNDESLIEIDDGCQVKTELMDAIDMNTNFLADIEFNFDCESPKEIHKGPTMMKVGLRLDHEAVIAAWSSCRGRSPWTNGERPRFNLDDRWPDFMGTAWGSVGGRGLDHGDMGLMGRHVGSGDGGREARVSRYREKRRTRLFSKKIRYEVRKLNAEKRPRMKGRFVKRTALPPPPPVSAAAAAAAGLTYV